MFTYAELEALARKQQQSIETIQQAITEVYLAKTGRGDSVAKCLGELGDLRKFMKQLAQEVMAQYAHDEIVMQACQLSHTRYLESQQLHFDSPKHLHIDPQRVFNASAEEKAQFLPMLTEEGRALVANVYKPEQVETKPKLMTSHVLPDQVEAFLSFFAKQADLASCFVAGKKPQAICNHLQRDAETLWGADVERYGELQKPRRIAFLNGLQIMSLVAAILAQHFVKAIQQQLHGERVEQWQIVHCFWSVCNGWDELAKVQFSELSLQHVQADENYVVLASHLQPIDKAIAVPEPAASQNPFAFHAAKHKDPVVSDPQLAAPAASQQRPSSPPRPGSTDH